MPVAPIIASAAFEHFLGGAAWRAQSLSMTLAPGNYFLMFSHGNSGGAEPFGGAWGADDYYLGLDNVSLEAAAVPEPPTVIANALLLLPFAASTVRLLRRRFAQGA